MEIEEQEKTHKKNDIKLYKYVGETSRSAYERGWEHLNDLSQLKKTSHMLKHIVATHEQLRTAQRRAAANINKNINKL